MENCANLALQIADQKTALDKWKQQKSSREGLLRSQPRGVRPGQRALRRGVPACPFCPWEAARRARRGPPLGRSRKSSGNLVRSAITGTSCSGLSSRRAVSLSLSHLGGAGVRTVAAKRLAACTRFGLRRVNPAGTPRSHVRWRRRPFLRSWRTRLSTM